MKEFSRHGDNTPSLSTYIKRLENLSTVLRKKQGKWHESCQLRFNSTKLARLRKRVHEGSAEEQVKQKSMRSTTAHSGSEKFPRKCFFDCNNESNKQTLHSVTTFQADRRLRKIATEMNDSVILANLIQGDMIAIEACMVAHM